MYFSRSIFGAELELITGSSIRSNISEYKAPQNVKIVCSKKSHFGDLRYFQDKPIYVYPIDLQVLNMDSALKIDLE